MAEFTCKNRGALTLFIILIAVIVCFIDGKIEQDSNTLIQWITFFVAVLALMYINFIACVDEIEFEEEEYIVPSLQDKQVDELTDVLEKDFIISIKNNGDETMSMPIKNGSGLNIDVNGNGTFDADAKASKEKIFYVVQPIHVTQEEFNEKINQQINMENQEPKKELAKALADPAIVISYSLHNINRKFRSMYADICGFAIGAQPKKETEVTAKVTGYGIPFTTERSGKTTIAFNLECEPKLRVPETGYFEVK